jgi:hypothetical protein
MVESYVYETKKKFRKRDLLLAFSKMSRVWSKYLLCWFNFNILLGYFAKFATYATASCLQKEKTNFLPQTLHAHLLRLPPE